MTTPAIAAARATKSHRSGAAPPKSAQGVVSRTGSGFHDGPSAVERSRWRISRPQMIHASGSYVGADGKRKVSPASARTATTTRTTRGRMAIAGTAKAGARGLGAVSSCAVDIGGAPIVAQAMLPAVKPCHALSDGRCTSATPIRRPPPGLLRPRSDLQPGVLEVEVALDAVHDLVVDAPAVAQADDLRALGLEHLAAQALVVLRALLQAPVVGVVEARREAPHPVL